MYKFAIYTNFEKDVTLAATRKIVAALEQYSCEIYLEQDLYERLGKKHRMGIENADYLFVLGGDGTILSVARKYAHCKANIIGVNLGRMGFLAELMPDEVDMALSRLMAGAYGVEKRMMLKASAEDAEEEMLALNDFVISPRNIPRMVCLELLVNGLFAERYYCDGIIISSPTGSTGYTISAGGPIVAPDVRCMLVTPVCAHTLNARSIVIKDTDKVEVRLLTEDTQAYITADGQFSRPIGAGNLVRIEKADCCARFIRVKDNRFFNLLKAKLAQWQDSE